MLCPSPLLRPCLRAISKKGDANVGPQLLNPASFAGIELQLRQMQAVGVKAVKVEIGFPMLYEPFLTSQGQSYSQFVNFYKNVAAAVKAAGLELIIENGTLANDARSGWNVASFYATLDWTQYQQARAQTALTIAQALRPDYLVVVDEPAAEADNSEQGEANTPWGSAALLQQILASVRQSGVAAMKVGAGTGIAQTDVLSFIQQYVAQPVDFIDMHIDRINQTNLTVALQIENAASAAGKPVSMSECWLSKTRDSELGTFTPDQVRTRDPFSFWAPLDSYFLQTMENLTQHTKMLFMAPKGSEYLAAYLQYGDSGNLTPSQTLLRESAQADQNLRGAIYSSTAMSYYRSLVSPRDAIPPSTPAGLTGTSGKPTTVSLHWNPSTDNVGVAGYNVFRNGIKVATTANLHYEESGLSEADTYSYSVEAFDLAGNTSALSLRSNVTAAGARVLSEPYKLVSTTNAAVLNVKNFGASGNALSFSDGYVSGSVSSPVLNAPVSKPFKSSDVGKLVEIQNSCLNAGSVSTLEGTITAMVRSAPRLPP